MQVETIAETKLHIRCTDCGNEFDTNELKQLDNNEYRWKTMYTHRELGNDCPVPSHVCEGCGTRSGITPKVADFSMVKYNQVLCYDCQPHNRHKT